MESELIAAVKSRSEDKNTFRCLETWWEKWRRQRFITVSIRHILAVITALTQLSQQYDLRINDMFGVQTDYFRSLQKVEKTENIRQYLTEVAFKMNRAMEEERSNTTKNVIQEARQYIQGEFPDPDLSVEKICRHLHMSPAYFSTDLQEGDRTGLHRLSDRRAPEPGGGAAYDDGDKTYIIAEKVGYPGRIISVMSLKRNSGYLRQNSGSQINGKKDNNQRGPVFSEITVYAPRFLFISR